MPSPLQLQRVVYPAGAPGGSEGSQTLSDDTTLSTFSINDENVGHGQTIQRGNGVTEVDVIATPTHAGATRTINLSSAANPVAMSLSVGDSVCVVIVTAQDGVTTQNHEVTVRRLTAGLPEITTFDFTGLEGYMFYTGSTGKYIDVKGKHIYFDTGTESAPASGVDGSGVVYVDSGDGADALAISFRSVVQGSVVGLDSVTRSGSVVTMTDSANEARTDSADFNTGVVVTVTQQGEYPT